MIKKLLSICLITMSLFISNIAFAAISSINDIDAKIMALNKVVNVDFGTMYSKSQLIGNTTENFARYSEAYRRSAQMAVVKLQNIKEELKTLNPDTDKSKIAGLYMDATNTVYDFDFKTNTFIKDLEYILPSLTYQKFAKNYNNFYNTLNLLK